jgi:DnaJ-class molecular chaperone
MGEVIRASDKCKTCKGERLIPEDKVLNVHVERGAGNGDRIVFAGASDEIPDVETGDAVVVLKQAEHPVFERHNDDLLIHKKISLYEALYGVNFVIEHLDGRKLIIESDGSVISPDTVKVTFRCTEKMHNVFYDRFGDVMMTAEDDNYFRVTVPVAVSPQFFGWVLGLGKNVQIIGPEEVRTQMREYLAGISEYYQAPPTT